MPFCDGMHIKTDFEGTETASTKPFLEQARTFEGHDITLKDAVDLCSVARFCHPKTGTWKLVVKSKKPEAKQEAIRQACSCPAGRLVIYDKKNGQPIENKHEPSITVTEDHQARCSGPLWVKGGIEIESESESGKKYEARNRVTLCRCGNSNNKPFCDGAHLTVNFDDGDKSVKE